MSKPKVAVKAEPMGPKEVAEFLAVKRATVQQWLFRKVMPDRDYTIGGQPAWEKATIIEWAVETERLEADDPRTLPGWEPEPEPPAKKSRAKAGAR